MILSWKDLFPYKDDVINLYTNENKSLSNLAEIYGCSRHIVRKFLSKNGIEIQPGFVKHIKYNLNEHWLDEIDSEEKLYFLGFFAADGCNKSDSNIINIILSKKDEEVLYKFKKLFESDRPFLDKKPYKNKKGYISDSAICMDLYSPYLCKRLTELGLPSRKSLTLEFPKWLTKEQFWPFVRGYFDGDGCFGPKGEKYTKITIESSRAFLETLKEKLEDYGIKAYVSNNGKANELAGRMDIQSKDGVRKFMDYIYKDANIYLERKYNRYYSYYYENKPFMPYD